MARRRRSDDPFELAAQLFGLGLVVAILLVGVRSPGTLFGMALLIFALLVGAAIALFLIIRYSTSKPARPFDVSPATARLAVNLPTVDLHAPAKRAIPPRIGATRPSRPTLMHQLQTIDWFQFEKLVALAYRQQGYLVDQRGGANADGGIDMVIRKEGVTQAVQCKQWKKWKVNVSTVREFIGALAVAKIERGLIITLCGSTRDAQALAAHHGIQILDGTKLADMLLQLDAAYSPEVQALLNDTRKFCPKCEHEMVLRPARRGPNAGKNFWGCSTYPRCRYTMSAGDNQRANPLR